MAGEGDAEIERLPVDLLSHIFSLLSSFRDLAQASGVCWKWRRGVEQSLACRERLSFAGQRMDDEFTARLVCAAYNLKELNMLGCGPSVCGASGQVPSIRFRCGSSSRSCWGCQITDEGLYKISFAKCVGNLTSISLWGLAGITDIGVIYLVSRAYSLQHLNIGGTFIMDESLYAIANSCRDLKTIILWCCRHVTESGLFILVNKCRKLESINVGGMRVPANCFISLLAISPALQIKSISQHLSIGMQAP